MSEPCLLCGAATQPVLSGVPDNRFGSSGEWTILRCAACGLEQTSPRPTGPELKTLYETYYNYGGESGTTYTGWREKLLMSPLYRVFLELDGDVSFHLEEGSGRLLDVGCNEGRGLVLYRRNGFTVVTESDKDALLRKYWSIPERQIETSVVLADARYFLPR